MSRLESFQIDPALRQNSLTSPPKPRDIQHYQDGAQPGYSPLQPSPNNSYQGMQTPSYYGNPPQGESPEEQSPSANPNDPNDLKRPRACEACRQLKVKCEPDESSPTGACKRCAKANRQCVVTAPSRKRQKKTDSRVAELEKKIDALTATLAAKGGSESDVVLDPAISQPLSSQGRQRSSTYGEQWTPHSQPTPVNHQSSPSVSQGLKRKPPGEFDLFGSDLPKPPSSGFKHGLTSQHYSPIFTPELAKPKQDFEDPPFVDVVDQNIIDLNTCRKCFERYMAEMCTYLPLVMFPPGTKADDIRKNKPILFLAVLAVASGTIRPELQPKLILETTRVLADRVVYRSEKSLELVQAIQVITIFYQPPERYEELNFNQLIHIAAVMAMDLGMGKRAKKSNITLFRPHPDSKRLLADPNSAETRRCWLGCYYLCSNSAMSLRRPLLIRWGPYADECMEILNTASDVVPSDQWLSLLVRGQRIAEGIGARFSMDDGGSLLSLTDPETQHYLRDFERQLAEWHDSATKDMIKSPIMQHCESIINLYMHEIAMHDNHNVDDFRPPFNATPIDGPPDPDFITPIHIESLTTCLNSVHVAFDAFLSLNIKTLRALPTFVFVRNSYAAVALIKMYTAVSAKGSKLSSFFKTVDLRVEYYLDRLITILTQTGENGMCKVAYKFSVIFNMLKSWHMKRTEPMNGNGSHPVSRQRTPAGRGTPQQSATSYKSAHPPHQQQDPNNNLAWNQSPLNPNNQPHQQQQQQQQQHQQQSRNGLQMLSDAAMGPGPAGPQPPPPQQQQWVPQQQQQMNQPQMMTGPMGEMSSVVDPNMMAYGIPGAEMGPMDFTSDELMAYGFGDEFMAMNFGMDQGGWAF